MHSLIYEFNLSSTEDRATVIEGAGAGAAGVDNNDDDEAAEEVAAAGVDNNEVDKKAPDEVYTRSFIFVSPSIDIILKKTDFFNTIPLRVALTLRSIFVLLHW